MKRRLPFFSNTITIADGLMCAWKMLKTRLLQVWIGMIDYVSTTPISVKRTCATHHEWSGETGRCECSWLMEFNFFLKIFYFYQSAQILRVVIQLFVHLKRPIQGKQRRRKTRVLNSLTSTIDPGSCPCRTFRIKRLLRYASRPSQYFQSLKCVLVHPGKLVVPH